LRIAYELRGCCIGGGFADAVISFLPTRSN
jgi:hypothetical protein